MGAGIGAKLENGGQYPRKYPSILVLSKNHL
jgi:hypothetical protein